MESSNQAALESPVMVNKTATKLRDAGTAGHCLGRHIPAEILNYILDMVLEEDNTALILPEPVPLADLHEIQIGAAVGTKSIIITSLGALHRVHRASRVVYNPMFKAKFVNLKVKNMLAIVQDLDFDCFKWNIIKPRFGTDALRELVWWEFTLRLVFREDFLQSPSDKGIKRWLDYVPNRDETWRSYHFDYEIEPIPNAYVEHIRHFFNQLTFERGREPGPELEKLLHDIGERYQNGEIVKEGVEWQNAEQEDGYEDYPDVVLTEGDGLVDQDPTGERVVTDPMRDRPPISGTQCTQQ